MRACSETAFGRGPPLRAVVFDLVSETIVCEQPTWSRAPRKHCPASPERESTPGGSTGTRSPIAAVAMRHGPPGRHHLPANQARRCPALDVPRVTCVGAGGIGLINAVCVLTPYRSGRRHRTQGRRDDRRANQRIALTPTLVLPPTLTYLSRVTGSRAAETGAALAPTCLRLPVTPTELLDQYDEDLRRSYRRELSRSYTR